MVLRGIGHESEVLCRQVDGRLVTLRACHSAGPGCAREDLEWAERVAEHLRVLVAETTSASSVDRARVRAAVHYFVGLRSTRERRRARSLADDLRVVDDMVRELSPGDVVWA